MHPLVWVVATNADERAVWSKIEEWNLPVLDEQYPFSNWYRSAALLDGLVVGIYPEHFGSLPYGSRVIGVRPLWLLCTALDLRAPRRLAGFVHPGDGPLLQALREQQASRDQSLERARWGLELSRKADVLDAIEKLWPGALTDAVSPSAWQGRGFRQDEVDALAAAGIDPETAQAWRSRNLPVEWIVVFRDRALDEACAWHALEIDPRSALDALNAGIEIAEFAAWEQHEVMPNAAADALLAGRSLEEWLEQRDRYTALGFSQYGAFELFTEGVSPSEVEEWMAAGVSKWDVLSLRWGGHTLEEARDWKDAGVEPVGWWMALSRRPTEPLRLEQVLAWRWTRLNNERQRNLVETLLFAGIDGESAERYWAEGARSASAIMARFRADSAPTT